MTDSKAHPFETTPLSASGLLKSDSIAPELLARDLLPRWTYQSSEFFQLEVQNLFRPAWLLVGHRCDFRKTGDYITFDAFDEQVVVVRDAEGQLNAFHNICRHRNARVMSGVSGNCRQSMMCPFHGWSYGLNGKLLNVPAADTFDPRSIANISLEKVELECWLGFVFVRLQRGGPSLQTQMEPMQSRVELYQPARLQSLNPPSIDIKPYNWKCIHDIDNEGYHVPVGHPALQQLYGQDYRDEVEHGFMTATGTISDRPARLWSVRHYQNLLPEFEHLPQQQQKQWFYLQYFPNLVFAFYPDMMEIYMTIPESVTSTRFISRTYALPDDRRSVRAARYLNVRINNETAEEDEKFVSWLQQGMKSSAWREPRLSSLESGVRQFHRQIQRKLPVSCLKTQPNSDEIDRVNREMVDCLSD